MIIYNLGIFEFFREFIDFFVFAFLIIQHFSGSTVGIRPSRSTTRIIFSRPSTKRIPTHRRSKNPPQRCRSMQAADFFAVAVTLFATWFWFFRFWSPLRCLPIWCCSIWWPFITRTFWCPHIFALTTSPVALF